MTSLLDAPEDVRVDPAEPLLAPLDGDDASSSDGGDRGAEAGHPVGLGVATVSGALSAMGAAWMVGGVFRGAEARLTGMLGAAIGAACVYLGGRLRSTALGYLVLPLTLVVGAVLMSSASGAGTSSLPALVKDAATSSHVLQPPIDFAPGWRLIVVVVVALLSAAAVALALGYDRPRLAVAVPAPLTVVAALIQPGSSAVTTGAVSVGFVVMALATSYAADGLGERFDAAFEYRRLLRSVLGGLVLVGLLVAASRVEFLFPDTEQHHIVPPRRPPVSPPQPDVPLYRVTGPLEGPLRVGVIDTYSTDEGAWLLPPVDNRRLVRLELPASTAGGNRRGPATSVEVTVLQATGRILPTVAGMRRVEGDGTVELDPRTQALSSPTRPVYTGLRYRLLAGRPPSGEELRAAEPDVPAGVRQFLAAPPVPPAVEALLREAPQGAFDRLQFLRTRLYERFVAAGQGRPTDVDADRVVELLGGGSGNPYELTASEALLARWAGVPSRIGFGYHDDGRGVRRVEFRPADAATYLEVHFAPYGWVPIVGSPPRAQQSLSNNQRENDPTIEPSAELGITVYLPVRRPGGPPLHEYVRYYAVRVLPIAAGAGAVVLLYPLALKRWRRRRRDAWAAAHGPAGAVAVAYCELRDRMIDLALPGAQLTPLELAELVEDDEEHAELAWLATRGLWGDLRTRLTDEDAVAARTLSDSVRARVTRAQPETARLLAAVSRASLRQPYSTEVPNVWWRRTERRPRLRLRSRPVGSASLLLLLVSLALTAGACSSGDDDRPEPVVALPTRLAPPVVAGLEVREEPKAADAYLDGARDEDVIVSEGKVLSFNRAGLVQAALQVAQLKRGYVSDDDEVANAIARSVGDVKRLRPQRDRPLYGLVDGSQRMYLWFPTVKAMAILVVRSEITAGAAEALARSLIDYGDGRPIDDAALGAAFAVTAP